MNEDFSELIDFSRFENEKSEMALGLDFVPQCGFKFLLACCDSGLKLFDFETEKLLQEFPGLYGYLCDCVQFVFPEEISEEENEFHLITKGLEFEEEVKPSICHLMKLTLPTEGKGKFRLEQVNNFSHPTYFANIWSLKFVCNGRYIISVSAEGNLFVWNIRSGDLVAVINEHNQSALAVRDICIHPSKPQLVVSGEDSFVSIFEPGKFDPPKPLRPVKEVKQKKGKKSRNKLE